MKYNFLISNFDPDTGISFVKIATKDGKFIGHAKLTTGDRPSEFLGCQIAERRAYVKALKARRAALREQFNGLYPLYQEYKSDKNIVKLTRKSPFMRLNRHMLEIHYKIQNITTEIAAVEAANRDIVNEYFSSDKNP